MFFHQRVASIIATDGVSGLIRRATKKAYRTVTSRRQPESIESLSQESEQEQLRREEAEITRAKHEYPRLSSRFRDEVLRRNLGDIDGFYWYHSVDVGDGLVTPGDYDFRDRISEYPFPEDMRGMTALDVGSATGFFAFEFERRGADVTSVELPSAADWDMIWSDRSSIVSKRMARHGLSTVEQLDWACTHGPFEFCRRLRNSNVRRVLSRIYDLTPEKLGCNQFDFIFLGDILRHLFSPLTALNVLAPLCRKEMVISLSLVDLPHSSIFYGGGESLTFDGRSWFQPNWEGIRQMLRRVGFRNVERVRESRVLVRRAWQWISRDLIRATK